MKEADLKLLFVLGELEATFAELWWELSHELEPCSKSWMTRLRWLLPSSAPGLEAGLAASVLDTGSLKFPPFILFYF